MGIGTLGLKDPTLQLWTILSGAPNFWIIPLIFYAGIYFMLSGGISALFGRVLALHMELEKLVSVIHLLEKMSLTKFPTIRQVCAPLLDPAHRPTRSLGRLSRIYPSKEGADSS